MSDRNLLIAGLGYTGLHTARFAAAAGWTCLGTRRTPTAEPADIPHIAFEDAGAALSRVTHLLITAPPGPEGDPLLARHADALRDAPNLAWIGYFSSTGVYGDHAGATVTERTQPVPSQRRAHARLAAERAWAAFAGTRDLPLDLLRLGGIYGPGRSAFEQLDAPDVIAIDAPGHVFGRIHRDDVARATLAAIATARPGIRVLNLVDDLPAEPRAVLEEAARLSGRRPPPVIPLTEALSRMSEMRRSFWADRRVVDNAWTKESLGLSWTHPTYRDGLAAVLAEDRAEASPQPR